MCYKRVPLAIPNIKVSEWEYQVKPHVRSVLMFVQSISRQNISGIFISKSIKELTTKIRLIF